ncbi:hypothetical protein T4A_13048 [Trichinella pseudospiralis]|uniref:DUF19 domain-containing protein n=1 Tax=Trichinella pseudospiralis TaxID=6337 RepID=A0A0V1E295_TRIPS|nr:hypothetical protein T4A_13048 [Trichinella pseudospiralis]
MVILIWLLLLHGKSCPFDAAYISNTSVNEDMNCDSSFMESFIAYYFDNFVADNKTHFIQNLFFGSEIFLPPVEKTSTFIEMCEKYRAVHKQFKKCKVPNFDYYDSRRFALLQFSCIERYREAYKHSSCVINSTTSTTVSKCKPECDNLRPQTEKVFKTFDDLELENVRHQENMTIIYQENCLYVSCIKDCLIPELKASCGEEAVQLYDEEFTVAFETLNDIYKNEQIDEEDWPKECQLLGEKI